MKFSAILATVMLVTSAYGAEIVRVAGYIPNADRGKASVNYGRNHSTITNVIEMVGTNREVILLFDAGRWAIDTNVEAYANQQIEVAQGSWLDVATNRRFVVNAPQDIHPRWFGAYVDDGIDDRHAIQDCLECVEYSSNARRIVFESGQYDLLTSSTNSQFDYNGGACLGIQLATAHYGLQLVGSGKSTLYCPLSVSGSAHLGTNNSFALLSLVGPLFDVRVEGLKFEMLTSHVESFSGTNYLFTTRAIGLVDPTSAASSNRNMVVQNCSFRNCVQDMNLQKAVGVKILNCDFSKIGYPPAYEGKTSGVVPVGIYAPFESAQFVIQGNTYRGWEGDGSLLAFDGLCLGAFGQSVISDNVIVEHNREAIYCSTLTSMVPVVVSANYMEAYTAATADHTYGMRCSSPQSVVEGNIIRNATVGILVNNVAQGQVSGRRTPDTYEGCKISDNTILFNRALDSAVNIRGIDVSQDFADVSQNTIKFSRNATLTQTAGTYGGNPSVPLGCNAIFINGKAARIKDNMIIHEGNELQYTGVGGTNHYPQALFFNNGASMGQVSGNTIIGYRTPWRFNGGESPYFFNNSIEATMNVPMLISRSFQHGVEYMTPFAPLSNDWYTIQSGGVLNGKITFASADLLKDYAEWTINWNYGFPKGQAIRLAMSHESDKHIDNFRLGKDTNNLTIKCDISVVTPYTNYPNYTNTWVPNTAYTNGHYVKVRGFTWRANNTGTSGFYRPCVMSTSADMDKFWDQGVEWSLKKDFALVYAESKQMSDLDGVYEVYPTNSPSSYDATMYSGRFRYGLEQFTSTNYTKFGAGVPFVSASTPTGAVSPTAINAEMWIGNATNQANMAERFLYMWDGQGGGGIGRWYRIQLSDAF